MHRDPTPPLRRGLRRLSPFVVGGAVVILLVAIAAGYRFGEPEETPVAAPEPESPTTTGAPSSGVAGTSLTTVPATAAPSSTTAATVPSTTTLAPSEPVRGGVVTVGMVGEVPTLNPFVTNGAGDPVSAVARATTVGALRLDPVTLEYAPLVVRELPTVANGGLSPTPDGRLRVRYRIRDDAVWENGTPITGFDFLRTYEVVTGAFGVRSEVEDRYDAIVGGSILADEDWFEFTLAETGIDYLSLFEVILPAEQVAVSGFSTAWDDIAWPAGGPFRLAAVGEDGTIELEANPASWHTDPATGAGLPYLDALRIRLFDTEEEVIAAVESGAVDVAAVGGEPAVLEGLADVPGLILDVRRGPEWEQLGFQFGTGRQAVNPNSRTNEVDIRRAIASLLDREALVAEVQGPFGRTLDSFIALGWPAVAHEPWAELLDPATAAGILEAAVAEAGGVLTLSFTTTANDEAREELARALVRALEPAGVTVSVELEDPGAFFFDRVIPGDFEVAAWAWEAALGPDGVVGDLLDHHVVGWPDGTDFYQWGTTAEAAPFVEMLTEAAAEVDMAALEGQLADLEAALADAMVLVPLYAELNAAAVRADVIGGFAHSVLPGGETATAAGWWRLAAP